MQNHRVAIVYHFFGHYRGPILRELFENGAHYYLAAGDTKDPLHSGIKEYEFKDMSRFVRIRSFVLFRRFLVQPALLRFVLRKDIDTFIFLGDVRFLTTWVAAIIGRLLQKRILFWTQGWTKRESGIKSFVRSAFYHLSHGLLLYGDRARQIAIEKGFKKETLYVIYNSLDFENQRKLRSGFGNHERALLRSKLFGDPRLPQIICTTRLIKVRRLDLLFEAAAILKSQGYLLNLLIVGDGPERNFLERTATHHGLAVKFFGECYDESVLAELIISSDLTVAPGKVGLTAIHSLAYGIPVMTHDDPNDQMPESEAIVAGATGGFFRSGDSKDLARAMKEWFENRPSADLVRSKCIDIVERFYNPKVQRLVIDRAILETAA